MKKFISVILALVMCFSFVSIASAADETQIEKEIFTQTDVSDSFEAESDNGELEKIMSVMTKAVTYIYDYATKPEEPAVELETVITIVQVVVYVIYGIIQQYQADK